jgi:hypothetical protein
MDSDEGKQRGLETRGPTLHVREDDQIEPWAWGDKRMPWRIRRRLELYREFLERIGDRGNQ